MVVSRGAVPNSDPPWRSLLLGIDAPLFAPLGFGFENGGWHWVSSGVSAQSLVGCWHHVAGTWGPRGMEIWLDGVLRGTDPYNGAPSTYDSYYLGCNAWGKCLPGRIDEVRISSLQRSFSADALARSASALVRPSKAYPSSRLTLGDFSVFLPFVAVAPTPVCPFGY